MNVKRNIFKPLAASVPTSANQRDDLIVY